MLLHEPTLLAAPMVVCCGSFFARRSGPMLTPWAMQLTSLGQHLGLFGDEQSQVAQVLACRSGGEGVPQCGEERAGVERRK
jgi:hypothetical protein